jgi:hypothetical protein
MGIGYYPTWYVSISKSASVKKALSSGSQDKIKANGVFLARAQDCLGEPTCEARESGCVS